MARNRVSPQNLLRVPPMFEILKMPFLAMLQQWKSDFSLFDRPKHRNWLESSNHLKLRRKTLNWGCAGMAELNEEKRSVWSVAAPFLNAAAFTHSWELVRSREFNGGQVIPVWDTRRTCIAKQNSWTHISHSCFCYHYLPHMCFSGCKEEITTLEPLGKCIHLVPVLGTMQISSLGNQSGRKPNRQTYTVMLSGGNPGKAWCKPVWRRDG